MKEPIKICLWSCPRNVSTALMYSFAQRADCEVFDEPLYAFYLRETGVEHPLKAETLASMEANGERVVREIILAQGAQPVRFYKLMTHFLLPQLDRSFLKKTQNVLFIRNPIEILNSYAKVIPNPTMSDIGVQMQYDLYHELHESGHLQAVLDSKYLLMNPERTLRALCEVLEIPFDEKMLRWEAGARPEDGAWAAAWYENVHRSTGFASYQPKTVTLPAHLQPLADRCQPLYEFLSERSIGRG